MNAFDSIVTRLDYPMFIVTTAADGINAGCLVGFACQVSIEPQRFLVGISDVNATAKVAARATHVAVHVLGEQHMGLARLFGEQTGDQVDKFERCAWHPGPHGLPILDDAAAWFGGEILGRIPLGDHTGYLIAPSVGADVHAKAPLVTLADVRDFHPGHEVD